MRAREQATKQARDREGCMRGARTMFEFAQGAAERRPSFHETHRVNLVAAPVVGSFVSEGAESTQPLNSITMDADTLNLSSDLMASASGYCLTTEEMAFLPPSLNILKNEHGFSRWISRTLLSLSLSLAPPNQRAHSFLPAADSCRATSPLPFSFCFQASPPTASRQLAAARWGGWGCISTRWTHTAAVTWTPARGNGREGGGGGMAGEEVMKGP